MTFTHDYCVKQTYIDKWQTSALSIHTLKRSLYKIWYLINACNVWLLCIVHTNLSVNGGKTVSCTKLSMGNGRCEIRYVLRLLVHSKVVAEFGRKEFLVDCLLYKKKKTLNMAKITITERAQAFSCNHSRKHNCDEISKWRHSVGSSTTCPCQSRYDFDTGLRIMARG